jgi:excisionase family DNA binding protein
MQEKREMSDFRDRLLTVNQIAEMLQCSRAAVYKWLDTAGFPQGIKIGIRARRWPESQVWDWIKSQELKAKPNQESRRG